MSEKIAIDVAILEEKISALEKYIHEAEARCKERDERALEEIVRLKNENAILVKRIDAQEKKLTNSAIVWATICGTVATLFAAAVWVVNKTLEWKNAFQGLNK